MNGGTNERSVNESLANLENDMKVNNRIIIQMLERAGGETHFHALILAPEGMATRQAVATINETYYRVSADEEWNYDDILLALADYGFEKVEFETWWEPI